MDLAVIAVPCGAVEEAVDDCLAARVPAIVVISAGFAEMGDAGREREAAVREKIRRAGARMIGPNCMGIVNTDPAFHMNATFSPTFPPAGSIGFSGQSGALGLPVLECAQQLNLGISTFASIGNKADVSTNDLLEFHVGDPALRRELREPAPLRRDRPQRRAAEAHRGGEERPVTLRCAPRHPLTRVRSPRATRPSRRSFATPA